MSKEQPKKELISKEDFSKQLDQYGVNDLQFKVIKEILYPNVQKIETLLMALAYCKARKLDIMKKPIQIVPIWNKDKKHFEDTIWPSITEVRITATRTGKYAGTSDAEFGKDITEKFDGVSVTYPEWCKIIVYRLVDGVKCEFPKKLFWKQNYKTAKNDTTAPNTMWLKKPHEQLEKCAEAAALRKAFPEELGESYIAEEAFSKEDMVDITPATKSNSSIDSTKLPDLKPSFVEESKQVDPEEAIEGKEFDLYSKIRLELMEAENAEQIENIAEFYKSQFSSLTKEQQKDLSGVKKARLELFAAPDLLQEVGGQE